MRRNGLARDGGDELSSWAEDETVTVLARAVDLRDRETGGHLLRVVGLVAALSGQLGFSWTEQRVFCHGAVLHDIGKMGIPDSILRKPAPLTDEEWVVMRRHPELGAALVHGIPGHAVTEEIILQHHERWDGSGYPFGRQGEEICVGARILAVADAVDAMTNDRVYSRARSIAEARGEVLRCSGSHFDPTVSAAFLALSDRELAASRLGVGTPDHRSAAEARSLKLRGCIRAIVATWGGGARNPAGAAFLVS